MARAHTWDDFQVVADSAQVEATATKLTENGLGALMAWVVGPQRAVGAQVDVEAHLTRVTTRTSEGTESVTYVPRSVSDQATIDDAVNDFLADAGNWVERIQADASAAASDGTFAEDVREWLSVHLASSMDG